VAVNYSCAVLTALELQYGGVLVRVYELKGCEMKRDMDLIRDLLLFVESDSRFDGVQGLAPSVPSDMGISNHSMKEIIYHLNLLLKEKFLDGIPRLVRAPIISNLTWQGHEFLDDIRDPDIWDKTKERAKGITSIGLAFIWEIAKAEIRTRLGLP
jgi:hypothetical protein